MTGSDAGGGDNFLIRESGSRTAISVNTGLGVLPASRANCAASGSVGSHVTHPQPVDTDIRAAGGLAANTADHRASPCSRVRPARLHSSRSWGCFTAIPAFPGRIAVEALDSVTPGVDRASQRRTQIQPPWLQFSPGTPTANSRTRPGKCQRTTVTSSRWTNAKMRPGPRRYRPSSNIKILRQHEDTLRPGPRRGRVPFVGPKRDSRPGKSCGTTHQVLPHRRPTHYPCPEEGSSYDADCLGRATGAMLLGLRLAGALSRLGRPGAARFFAGPLRVFELPCVLSRRELRLRIRRTADYSSRWFDRSPGAGRRCGGHRPSAASGASGTVVRCPPAVLTPPADRGWVSTAGHLSHRDRYRRLMPRLR